MTGDDDERRVLEEALRGVRPIGPANPRPAPPPRPPRARLRRSDELEVLRESLEISPVALDVETGEELLFRRAGVPADVLRALRRGRYTVAAELDLHGLTEREAKQVLREFLGEALLHGQAESPGREQRIERTFIQMTDQAPFNEPSGDKSKTEGQNDSDRKISAFH